LFDNLPGNGGRLERIEDEVTAQFTVEEHNLLVRLPRWIVGAASAAHADSAGKTQQEINTGLVSVANGRKLGSALVSELADAAIRVYDDDLNASNIDPSTAAGREQILAYAQLAVSILREKADATDAAVYRRWLINITDDVISAVDSDSRFGFGGTLVHADEQAFRDKLRDMTRAPSA